MTGPDDWRTRAITRARIKIEHFGDEEHLDVQDDRRPDAREALPVVADERAPHVRYR